MTAPIFRQKASSFKLLPIMSETNNSNEVVVSIKNLQKAFGDNVVLRDIDLDVHLSLIHIYRTGEWTQDSEGFWRDSHCYYVVAAGDMVQGSTFTGSKGDCKVYDSGCAAGTIDYYTGW